MDVRSVKKRRGVNSVYSILLLKPVFLFDAPILRACFNWSLFMLYVHTNIYLLWESSEFASFCHHRTKI